MNFNLTASIFEYLTGITILILWFLPFILFVVWLYKAKWLRRDTIKHNLYGITAILVSHSIYTIIMYTFLVNILNRTGINFFYTFADSIEGMAYASSLFIFPFAALFLVISAVVFIFNLIFNRKNK